MEFPRILGISGHFIGIIIWLVSSWHREHSIFPPNTPYYGINLTGIFLLILDRKRVELYGFIDLGKKISFTPWKGISIYLVSKGCSCVSWLL
jgi:hypothetical protein